MFSFSVENNPNDDAEVVVVPLEKQEPSDVPAAGGDDGFGDFDDDDIITIGVVQPGFFSRFPTVINPYNWNFGFADRFDGITIFCFFSFYIDFKHNQ